MIAFASFCIIFALRIIMFYTTSFKSQDLDVLSQILQPNIDLKNNSMPFNYILHEPYRLIFSTVNTANADGYFNNCFVSPAGTLYSTLTADEYKSRNNMFKLHKHDFYEFMFVLDGEIYVNIENERHLYQKGSCYIVNKNVRHSEEFNTDFQVVFLQLSSELIYQLYSDLTLDFFDIEKHSQKSDMKTFLKTNLTESNNNSKDYVDFIPVADSDYLIEKVHNFFDNITRETLSPKFGSSIKVKGLLTNLIAFMSTQDNFSTTPIQIGTSGEYALFNRIAASMEETYGRISRSQLAEKLNYSGAYLNEICKKYSGLSLFDYGMTFCMKKAAELLTTTNENISNIEALLMFNNHTHFYKVFKDTFDMTPAEYRKRFSK